MAPEIHRELRPRNKISEHSDRVLAQNSEVVLAVIIILAGDTIFAIFYQEVYKHILRHPYERYRVRDSRIYTLMTVDPEIIPGVYFLKTGDPEIMPGKILSYDRGFRNHTRQ